MGLSWEAVKPVLSDGTPVGERFAGVFGSRTPVPADSLVPYHVDNELADLTLMLLPISSFWATIGARTPPSTAVLTAQVILAGLVIGGTWLRARPYRRQRLEFAAATGGPAA